MKRSLCGRYLTDDDVKLRLINSFWNKVHSHDRQFFTTVLSYGCTRSMCISIYMKFQPSPKLKLFALVKSLFGRWSHIKIIDDHQFLLVIFMRKSKWVLYLWKVPKRRFRQQHNTVYGTTPVKLHSRIVFVDIKRASFWIAEQYLNAIGGKFIYGFTKYGSVRILLFCPSKPSHRSCL